MLLKHQLKTTVQNWVGGFFFNGYEYFEIGVFVGRELLQIVDDFIFDGGVDVV